MDKIFKLLFSAALLLCCIMLNAQQPTGDGSQANPYLLTNYADLQWFAAQVNGGQNGICAKLTADITAGGTWTPIGNSSQCYRGDFDGDGHTISGLSLSDNETSNVGLFGKATDDAHIHHVGVVGCSFSGKDHVGGICGDFANGVIEYCYSTGTIYALTGDGGGLTGSCFTNAHIRQCHTSCAVTAGAGNYGGITGYLWGDINHCCVMEGKNAEGHVFYGGKTDDAVFADNAAHSEAAFKSGEVCYLLNGSSSVDVTWHQKLGDGGDDYPVLAQCEGNTVYLVHLCDGSDTYSNTDHGTQATHTPEYHPYTAPTETLDGNIEHWHCTTCGHNFEDEECTVEITGSVVLLHTTQLNNEIWYTSSTGQVIEPDSNNFGDCNIISNTYENGIGIIKFDNAVTSIGLLAFSECHSLTSVNIPASVTSIESTAFEGCCSLTSVTLNSNAIVSKTYSSNKSIEDIFGSQVTQYIIGTSVTSIGNSAFCDCKGLTSVTIPSSVTSIGEYAFRFCRGLTSVTFDGYRCENAIGSDAFSSVGSNVPATLTLPAEWAGFKPDNAGRWYGGKFSTVKYLTEEERVLGEMGVPCDDCPAIEVTDQNGKTIKLYNPESVKFKKE